MKMGKEVGLHTCSAKSTRQLVSFVFFFLLLLLVLLLLWLVVLGVF